MVDVGVAILELARSAVAALFQVPYCLVVGVPDIGGVLLAGGGGVFVVHVEDGV